MLTESNAELSQFITYTFTIAIVSFHKAVSLRVYFEVPKGNAAHEDTAIAVIHV